MLKLSSYGRGSNARILDIDRPGRPSVRVWFSYGTPVAFQRYGVAEPIRVRANDWGPITGRHLTAIDGGGPAAKRARLPEGEFLRLLSEAVDA